MIPALSGIITLAVEIVNFYLYRRRSEAIAKVIEALSEKSSQLKNMVFQFEDEFLIYG